MRRSLQVAAPYLPSSDIRYNARLVLDDNEWKYNPRGRALIQMIFFYKSCNLSEPANPHNMYQGFLRMHA